MDTAPQLDDFLTLPDAPALPGLRFRRLRGEVDYPAMLAVLNACRRTDQISGDITLARVRRLYPPQSTAAVLAEMDGTVIGLCRWQSSSLHDGTHVYGHVFHLDPTWRGYGIGRSLLHYCESMLCDMASQHQQAEPRPTHSRRVLVFLPKIQDTEVTLTELLVREGYMSARYFYEMVRPNLDELPAAILPAGLEVRQVQPDQYRAIYAAHKEAFHDHFASTPSSEQDYQNWLARNPCPHLWQVAWDYNQVAGMVLTAIHPEENRAAQRQRGYCDPISVRQAWRQRGLARALLVHSLHVLKAQGMTQAALTVDTANVDGALRLYESVGFRILQRSTIYNKPLL